MAPVLAACAMITLRVLTVDQTHRAVSLTPVVLGGSGPRALLAARRFLLTAVFRQLLSTTATALMVVPVALFGVVAVLLSPAVWSF